MLPIEGLVIEDKDGRTCPRFVCQHCGMLVEDSGMALIAWEHKGKQGWCLHKGECWRAFDAKHGGNLLSSPDIDIPVMWLLMNMGIKTTRQLLSLSKDAKEYPSISF